MSTHPTPNAGPAPEPSRTVNLGTSHDEDPDLIADPNRAYEWTPEMAEPESIESPPPPDPEEQSKVDEYERRVAELQEALAKEREKNRKELERMKLQLEASMTPAQPQQPARKADNGKAASAGWVEEYVQNQLQQQQRIMQGQMMIYQAGIPQDRVQEIVNKYPQLNNMTDPVQVADFIIRAYKIEEAAVESEPPPKEESKPKPVKTVAPGNHRPAAPAPEPAVESGDQLTRLRRQYEEAKKIKDKYERLRTMREIHKRIIGLQFKTDNPAEFIAQSRFIQK